MNDTYTHYGVRKARWLKGWLIAMVMGEMMPMLGFKAREYAMGYCASERVWV